MIILVKELGSSCTRATGGTVLRAGPMIKVRSGGPWRWVTWNTDENGTPRAAPMTLVRQTDDTGTAGPSRTDDAGTGRPSRTDGKGTLSYS